MKEFKVTVQSVYKGHHNVTYRGIKIIKCPFDYLIYQMIIFEVEPDLIIEIGSCNGGGALYLADLLNIIGHGELHTIDIVDNLNLKVKDHPRIKSFLNGYKNYDLSQASNYKKILVIEDGSHTYEDCLETLKMFSPIVTKDSYFIVEDGIIDRLGLKKKYFGGPKRAIKDFLKTNQNYLIDYKWCNLFGENATFNIDGYLKRIK